MFSQSLRDLADKQIMESGSTNVSKVIYKGNSYTLIGYNSNCNFILNSTNGEDWELVYQKDFSDSSAEYIQDIIWDGTKYVVTYGNSEIMISSDGYNWDTIESDIPKNCNRIIFDGSKYIMMKRDGNNHYYTSNNLVNWTAIISNKNQQNIISNLNDFVIKNGTYIAVGDKDNISVSGNGISKELQFGITNNDLKSGCFNNGLYVVAGWGDIIYSRDGNTWERADVEGEFLNVIYTNDKFIAVGYRKIAISLDGVNWTCNSIEYSINKITYGKGKYIAICEDGAILASNDAQQWDRINDDNSENLKSIIFNGDWFFAVGYSNTILKSNDGTEWSKIPVEQIENWDCNIDFNDILWDGSMFIAVGSNICTSIDGKHWINRSLGSSPGDSLDLTSITQFKNYYVATALFGRVMISSNGINWKMYDHTGDILFNVFHDNESLFLLGSKGGITKLNYLFKDSDKIVSGWQNNKDITRYTLLGIAANSSGRLVAVGDYGIIRTSTNGTDWSVVESGSSERLNGIKFLNNKFYVPADNGIIMYSTNGLKWNKSETGSTDNIMDIEYNGSIFVAVGGDGCILTSSDGLNWTTRTSGSGRTITLTSVCYFQGKFYAFGSEWYGRMFTSQDGINWVDSSGFNQDFDQRLENSACNKDTIVVRTSDGVIVSKNGSKWKFIPLDCKYKVFFTGDYFITYGNSSIFYSYDGYTWNREANDLFKFTNPNAIIRYNNKIFGVTDRVGYSTNARKWTEVSCIAAQAFEDIIWSNGKFVAVGNKGTIITSNDGSKWVKVKNSGSSVGILSIAWSGERYVAGSCFGSLLISKYGDDWTYVTLPNLNDSTAWVTGVKWVKDRFFAVTDSGEIYSSIDSYHWTKVYNYNLRTIEQGIVSNNNKIVGFGTSNLYDGSKTTVLASDNGVNWKKTQINEEFTSITCKNDAFIALTSSCKILTSSDGIKWQQISRINIYDSLGQQTIDSSAKIVWNGNQYLIIGNGKEMTSLDGVSWEIKDLSDVMVVPRSIAWNGSSYVAVGAGASIGSKTVYTNSKAASLTIVGDNFIPIKNTNTTYQFRAQVFDQYSKEVTGNKINWSIVTDIKNVTIDKASGKLSIPFNSSSGRILVRAEVDGAPYVCAIKTIYLGTKAIVSIDKSNLNLYKGQNYKLTALTSLNSNVSWSSSNNIIVTVDATGNVKTTGIGSAIVTLVLENGAYEASCIVNVSEKKEVSFNTNGGSEIHTQPVAYNNTLIKPADPNKTGYSFGGWYKEAACINVWNISTDKVTSNITLFAKWTINKYTVSFNSQGGTAVAKTTVNYNTIIASPAVPQKTGYTFGGWYSDAVCITKWNFATNKVTGSITLYAKWSINKYKLSFNTNGGTTIASKIIDYNKLASTPKNPTKAGYTFLGWYKETTFKTKWNFGTDKVTKNTTIYTKWTNNPSAPKTIKVTKSSSTNTKISWSSVNGVNRYELYRATSSSGSYNLITISTGASYTNKSLTKGKTYYYKVRTYKMVDNQKVYSGYSKILSIKI